MQTPVATVPTATEEKVAVVVLRAAQETGKQGFTTVSSQTADVELIWLQSRSGDPMYPELQVPIDDCWLTVVSWKVAFPSCAAPQVIANSIEKKRKKEKERKKERNRKKTLTMTSRRREGRKGRIRVQGLTLAKSPMEFCWTQDAVGEPWKPGKQVPSDVFPTGTEG